jgi:spermidine/putrescine transport system ATP-binding protein
MARDGLVNHQDVCISVRPEQMKLGRKGDGVEVKIHNRIFLGEHTEYLVSHQTLGNFLVLAPRQADLTDGGFAVGDTAAVSWEATAALIFDRN